MEEHSPERKHRKQRRHKRTNEERDRDRSRSRSPKKRSRSRKHSSPEAEPEPLSVGNVPEVQETVPPPKEQSAGFLSSTIKQLWSGGSTEQPKETETETVTVEEPQCVLERDGYRLMRACKFFEGSSLSPFKAYIIYAHSNMKGGAGGACSDTAISFVPCVLQSKEEVLAHCDRCLLDLAVSVQAEQHDVCGGVVVPLQFRDVYSPKLNDTDILRYKKGYDTTGNTKLFLVENVQFFDFSRGYCVALADNERECRALLKNKLDQCRHNRSRSRYKPLEPSVKYVDPCKPPQPIIGLSITLPGVVPTVR